MTTARPIYRLPADDRPAYVARLIASDELNRSDGALAISRPAVVTYEHVRGMSEPTTITGKLVGLARDAARPGYSLVVLVEHELVTVGLAVLVSIEATR